ncbi:MAG TPA: phosphatidylserine/phosphatidylglycerophosphate/cardiolipin synthase family protein [Anaerolineales bacterium]|nr:phosphatidylserine/phosphatidylglycerophosphate/cardiolipin synthase family protein [Anaerolineales bacterium]
MNKHTLFTKVQDYYENLVTELATAQTEISMSYLCFEDGQWAGQISQVLKAKVNEGVRVRLIVDEFGQLMDEPRRIFRNFEIITHLRSSGVQVDIFRPAAPLQVNNRIHAKFAAIDNRTVFLGGSNIGDYYTTWTDSNMRVDGDLGNTFHELYDFLNGFSKDGDVNARKLDTSNLWVGNERLRLTVPHHKHDIREALMDLILNAKKAIFIRTWYFLPDDEMLNALCEQAKKGIRVNVLISHKTRVRPVDFANYLHVHKLVCAGGNVYRYEGKYMHSKAAWNDQGDVLFGSANLDPTSMHGNFETYLEIRDSKLTWELRRAFYIDLTSSTQQTPESFLRRSLANKVLTYACNLVTPWL